MAGCRLVNVKGRGPVVGSKVGRFQVSAWQWKRVVPVKSESGFSAEREQDVHRACIRYAKWNVQTSEWDENSIWCNVDELRDLFQALDQLNMTDIGEAE